MKSQYKSLIHQSSLMGLLSGIWSISGFLVAQGKFSYTLQGDLDTLFAHQAYLLGHNIMLGSAIVLFFSACFLFVAIDSYRAMKKDYKFWEEYPTIAVPFK